MKANGRRLNGEGTIRWVKSRNSYHGQIRLTVDGVRKRKDVYGKTRGEVRDKLREANRQAEAGASPNAKETVTQYLHRWHDGDSTLRAKSIHSRLVNVNRMIPHIGRWKLTGLRANHIQAMYKHLEEELSDHSVKQVNAVLRKALKDAVKEGSILYNPIDRVLKQPTAKPREMDKLSSTEVKDLLAINDEWAPLFALLTGTGLRIGEALGMLWDNIDLEVGSLKVTRSLQRVAGVGLIFNEPKTESSRRTIPIGSSVVERLKAHRVSQAEHRLKLGGNWKNQGLVFPNGWGSPMEASRAYRALQRTLPKAGIDRHIRVHDLRHTAASLMIENGVPPKVVQAILGHSSYTTTMDIYVHTNPEMLRSATDILDKAISGA